MGWAMGPQPPPQRYEANDEQPKKLDYIKQPE
jgi:hypothetical protein